MTLHLGLIEKRIVRPDFDAERSRPVRDRSRDRAEGQKTKNSPTQAPYRLSGLPAPLVPAHSFVVFANLARGSEPKSDSVIGNLSRAPVVRNVRYLDPALRGGVHIDDVDTGSVAGDHTEACKRINGSRANGGVLSKYAVSIASLLNDFVFSFTLRGDELKSGSFDDPALDVYVAKVVVGDQYRLLWLCGFVCLHTVLLASRLVGV